MFRSDQMTGILDYIKWRGDLSFNERPFNDVDNLIFSELSYFNFDLICDSLRCQSVTIKDAYAEYSAHHSTYEYNGNDPRPLLAACAESERFGGVEVTDLRRSTDNEKQMQFAACTFVLPDNSIYVAFRGTDNTIVGWREDFNFSYMESAPAQLEAVNYINSILWKHEGTIRVGGHSKGGNLAVYASAFCRRSGKINVVYSNDGPGFNNAVISSKEMTGILDRIVSIIPESSIIGVLLNNVETKYIVKSSAEGAQQHSPYTWLVERDSFVTADSQTSLSLKLDEILDRWVDSVDVDKRKIFVDCIFDALEASGAETMAELHSNRLLTCNTVIKAAASLSGEARADFIDTVKKLGEAGKEVILSDRPKKKTVKVKKH